MDKPSPEDLLNNELPKMPKEIQVLFDSEDLINKLEAVVEKNNLSDEQSDALSDTVAYALFGIIPINSLKSEIQKELVVDDAAAISISTEVYGSILAPVKRFLKDSKDDIPQTKTEQTPDHKAILHEIENPSPTFSTTQILKTAAVPTSLGHGSEAIHEFHGFKPEPIAPNPAAAVATKLDKKLEEPTSHAPKEIYHVKPMDPYHEPTE